MELSPKEKLEKKYTFPKKVGVVFVETPRLSPREETASKKSWHLPNKLKIMEKSKQGNESLDFDQDACAFFFLQMNQKQRTFEFQVVEIETLPQKLSIIEWLDDIALTSSLDIDYWIAITNQQIGTEQSNYFFDTIHINEKPGIKLWAKSGKRLWVISSRYWERYFAPPSLFEYIACTLVRCALESLSRELQSELNELKKGLEKHDRLITKGCIFDFTTFKPLRRILVSQSSLCYDCRKKVTLLEDLVQEKINSFPLVSDIDKIVSRKWMGNAKKRDTPIYNLKKLYKYDVDRNSGFNKGLREKFRDSIYDKSAEWIVAGVIGAIITGVSSIVFRLLG